MIEDHITGCFVGHSGHYAEVCEAIDRNGISGEDEVVNLSDLFQQGQRTTLVSKFAAVGVG